MYFDLPYISINIIAKKNYIYPPKNPITDIFFDVGVSLLL
jgi:hypothetical protein